VHLAEEVLDELAGTDVLDLVHDPSALAAYPATAYVEDLDRGFELVFHQPDHVAVGAVRQHDGLLLKRPLQCLQVIAQPGRELDPLGRRRLAHLCLEPLGELPRLAGHEVAELLGEPHVLVRADPADARCRALADVPEQTWPADLAGSLEYTGRAG